MRTNLIVNLVLVSFLATLGSTAYISAYPGTLPVCQAGGTDLSYTATPSTASNILGKSTFYNWDDHDNGDIYARLSADSTKIQILNVGFGMGAIEQRSIVRVTGTVTESFHSLLGKVLITRTVDSANSNAVGFKYYYHNGINNIVLTGATITIPAAIGDSPWTDVDLKLVSYNDKIESATKVEVVCYFTNNKVGKGFWKNTVTIAGMTSVFAAAASPALGTSPDLAAWIAYDPASIVSGFGSSAFVVNPADGKCFKNDGTKFAQATPCDLGAAFVASSNWYSFTLFALEQWTYTQATTVVVSVKAGSAGSIQYAYDTAAPTKATLAPCSNIYRVVSDHTRNVIVAGSAAGQSLAWMSLRSVNTGVGPGVGLVTIALTTADHSKLINAVAISAANHRAFFLSSGFITVLVNSGTDITLMRQVVIASTLITTPNDYSVRMACDQVVYAVQRFTCFARSLNCVITNKGISSTPKSKIQSSGEISADL